MFIQLSAIIVDSDAENRVELCEFLNGLGVNVAQQLDSVEHLDTYLARSEAPQLAIVNLDPNAADMLHTISDLPGKYPGVAFFVMSQVLDPQLLMDAMAHGFREFVPLPIQEQKFGASLERVAKVHNVGRKGKIIQVIPTIGGCGSTTVACNIAASLAEQGKACLVDMDLVRGGCASAFDAEPRYNLADVMDNAQQVDPQVLDRALWVHENSGLNILPRPDLPEDTQRINQAGINKLMNLLGRMFDYTVVDSVMSIDPVYSTTIQLADMNVIVMQLNVPSARNAERFVGTLRRMGVESSKIKVVVNRYVKKGWDINPREVEKALGLEIAWMVPNDFKNAIAAINYGEPVVLRAPRSEISQSLRQFANSINALADTKQAA
ncbi:MAG: AAA family ATPase [Planctomycetota bacterium]